MKEFSYVFEDFAEWRKYLWNAAKHLFKGVTRLLFAIVFGVWSVLVHSWRAMVRFVGNYPNISLAAFFIIVLCVWALTFIQMRYRAVSAEDQRNLVTWQFKEFKKSLGYE